MDKIISCYLRWLTAPDMDFQGATASVPPPGTDLMLYVHVPFCETLCPFCTFHRVLFDADKAHSYFAALRSEIRRYHDLGFRFSGVYFGGGTPTVVPEELARTLTLIRQLGMQGKVSVETNPDHLRPDIVSRLCDAGVDRLSVGVQSFDDDLLREMGRFDRYGSGERIAERLARTRGAFETLNADLIFNLPHQSVASIQRDIDWLHEIGVDQVSYYPLMPAAATRRAMSEHMGQVDFGREKHLYESVLERMRPTYTPTSAWCFSRQPGMIDEYIIEQDEYLGVGSGAFSYVGGTLYSTSFSINRYIRRVESGQTGTVMRRVFTRRERLRYALLVGLFGLALPRERLDRIANGSAGRVLWKELLLFRALKAIRLDGDTYRLTDRGMYVWIVMMREFLMGVNRFREQMRHHVKNERRAGEHDIRVPVDAIVTRHRDRI